MNGTTDEVRRVKLRDVMFYDEIMEIYLKQLEEKRENLINVILDADLNAETDVLAVQRVIDEYTNEKIVKYEIVFKNTPCVAIVLKKRIKDGTVEYSGYIDHICECYCD